MSIELSSDHFDRLVSLIYQAGSALIPWKQPLDEIAAAFDAWPRRSPTGTRCRCRRCARQIRAVFQKLQVERQAELAGLLAGNPAFWGGLTV